MRIAVLDDDRQETEALEEALRGWDPTRRAECFADGAALLAAAKVQPPFTVAFIDIYLPKEDGVEIAKELAALSPKTDIVFVTTAATCEGTGVRTYTAAVTFGGKQFTDTETEVIAARGHSWGAWTQTKAPTCTAEGEEQRICANDPSHTQTRAVDELGHDRIRHEAKAPTCTEIGWEAYDTCSRCDYTTYREISAKGHTAGATVRENEKAPTCTEEGSYDEVVYCTVCEEELSRKTVTIDAAGHMAAVVEGKEATCTESGLTDGEKCSVCGETFQKQEEIPARGHDFGEWSVTEEAGIGREGEEQRTCSRCGETETRVIPAEAFPVWAIVLLVLLGILLVGGAAVLVIVVKRKKQA